MRLAFGVAGEIGTTTWMPTSMKPKAAAIPATTRPSRLLVALAVAWMVLTLAIGGAVNADEPQGASDSMQTVTSVANQ
jgi:hypothetical protein